eukprot:7220643-Pyramimonas_sp.AAC.1
MCFAGGTGNRYPSFGVSDLQNRILLTNTPPHPSPLTERARRPRRRRGRDHPRGAARGARGGGTCGDGKGELNFSSD